MGSFLKVGKVVTISLLIHARVSLACFTSSSSTHPSQNNPPAVPPARTSSCGHSLYYNTEEHFGIVGGMDAKQNEFPWTVRLRVMEGSSTYLCGAVVINNRWIATAAHCVQRVLSSGSMVAVFGDHDRTRQDSGEVSVSASQVIVHPSYNSGSTNDYDIAMVRLTQSLSFTKAIQPICLPSSCASSACQTGSAAWITGWGTQSESGSGAEILQKAWVPITSTSSCQSSYSSAGITITDRMICAGFSSGGVDTCQGDSGGPLVCNSNGYYELGGITSFGQGCARSGYYGVYTKVCSVVDWMKGYAAQP